MNQTKILRLCCLVLLAVMALSVFAGCDNGNTPDTSKEPTVVKPPESDDDTNNRDSVEDTVPKDLNFASGNKTEVNFFHRDYDNIFKYEIACEELLNDALFDAVHYRNIDVEARLGVKIKTRSMPGDWNAREAFMSTITTAVNTNTDDFDVAAVSISYGTPYALQNIYYNMQNSNTANGDDVVGYLDLSKPWWNQSLVDTCTIGGTLFFLGGDLTVSETAGTHNLWFCKTLFDEKFPEIGHKELYKMVDAGTWTIDKLAEFASQVWDDVNMSGSIDDGDTVGFKFWSKDGGQLSGWLNALDVDVLTRDTYGLYTLSETYAARAIPAYEKFKSLYQGEGTMLVDNTHAQYTGLTNITNGNLMFKFGYFMDGGVYRQSAANYGILPLPKYDEEQENYANGMWTTSSALVIGSNVSDERLEVITAVLEVMAAESYKQVTPAYYNKVITGVYSKDPADARMFELCLATCQYNFELSYGGLLPSDMLEIFNDVTGTTDIQNTIDSGKDSWAIKLEAVMIEFEMLAE